MRCIGVAGSVSLFAQSDSYISYFNSPFIGHSRASAIDVYPSHQEWNGDAYSPVDGRVTRIRKLAMGKGGGFPTSEVDYAIGIAPDDGKETVVRILHCLPEVTKNEYVSAGDRIGRLLRSRYFCFWTGPHYHVEVMKSTDFHRSSQSIPLEIMPLSGVTVHGDSVASFECEVISCDSDVIIGVNKRCSYVKTETYSGHLASSNDTTKSGILDAGFPYYKHGGVVGDMNPGCGSGINAWNVELGQVTIARDSMNQFRTAQNRSITLDDIPVRGIACHLYSRHQLIQGFPPVYIVPMSYGQLKGKLSQGDIVTISVE